MKKIIFITGTIICLLFANTNAQGKIDSILIYSYFNGPGLTTAGAYSTLKDLKSNHTKKFLLPASQVERINQILQSVNPKKHFQTKLGGEYVFAEVYIQGKPRDFRFTAGSLFDMTNYRNYFIGNEYDKQWLMTFFKSIKE